ncbi:MAG TPA: benzoate/H(+) symporter BenE family transporter [Fluviicoccus sp.]|nr:benzoate/H(+) symporter BenE family transporter [Fluviicoccus sp.]
MAVRLYRDASLSAVMAGFVTVLVGFTASGVLIFQAAQALGATAAQTASWLWALGVGMAVTSIGLSLRYRTPIGTAWSSAGAALLIASQGVSLGEAIGAFMLSGLLIGLVGFTGLFERLMNRIPLSMASAMLAGILLQFGMNAFTAMTQRFELVFPMFAAYLLMRRWKPRYAVIGALLTGSAVAAALGQLHLGSVRLEMAMPVFMMPEFSWHTLLGLGVPLFAVTMASQNLPGVAAIRATGFNPPVSPVVGWTGAATLALAPFGAFAINLSAITAAIMLGREAHHELPRRYVAAVSAGVFYLLIGIFGATVSALFAAFPKELVLALAGLALLGTIGNGLATAVEREAEREPAIITFLVTASGVSLLGVGSAFWGIVAGGLALAAARSFNGSKP